MQPVGIAQKYVESSPHQFGRKLFSDPCFSEAYVYEYDEFLWFSKRSTNRLRSGTRRRICDSGQQASQELTGFSGKSSAAFTKIIAGTGQCDFAKSAKDRAATTKIPKIFRKTSDRDSITRAGLDQWPVRATK